MRALSAAAAHHQDSLMHTCKTGEQKFERIVPLLKFEPSLIGIDNLRRTIWRRNLRGQLGFWYRNDLVHGEFCWVLL
jgi:hypothetical protein